MTAVTVGAPAPDFDLPAPSGERAALKALRGKTVVLYFYPKDDTSGCTSEAKAFSDLGPAFAAAGAVVIGVSKDSVASHEKFKKKYDLALLLGSDETGAVVEAYGSWIEKSMYGRTYMGIDRSTFLIDAEGVVRQIWRKVKVAGHADAVLAAAKGL
jgi:peroxiredoxin Q/BCP